MRGRRVEADSARVEGCVGDARGAVRGGDAVAAALTRVGA